MPSNSEEQKIEAIKEGRQAQQLLDNPLFMKLFDDVEHDLIERWVGTATSNTEEREEIWRKINVLHLLKSDVKGKIQTLALLTDSVD